MITERDLADNGQLGEKLYKVFRRRYQKMQVAKHPSWTIAYQFYRGRQNVEYYSLAVRGGDTLSGVRTPVSRRGKGARLTVNKVAQYITAVGNSIYQRGPAVVHIPVTSEPNDVAIARLCDSFNTFLWRDSSLAALYQKLALIVPLWGTGFWVNYWERDWGGNLAYNLEEEMAGAVQRGENTQRWETLAQAAGIKPGDGQWPWVQDLTLGKPGDRVEMPHTIFLNDGALPDTKTWTDYIEAKMVPVSWLKENFSDVEIVSSSNRTEFSVLQGAAGLSGPNLEEEKGEDEWALFLTWRIRATKEFPRGLLILAGGENHAVLSKSETEFSDGRLGLYPVYWRVDPQSAYGTSLADDLIAPQIEYNEVRTQIADCRRRLKGQKVTPRGSGLEGKETTEPDEILGYNVGAVADAGRPPIEHVGAAEPPKFLMESEGLSLKDMADASSYHTPQLAAGTPKTRSALEYGMRTEDDARGRWTLGEQKVCLEIETTKNRLKLAKAHWPAPTKLRIVGEGNRAEVFEFDAAEVPEEMDVQAQDQGETILSRTLHEDRQSKFLMQGVFGSVDPNHPAQPLTMYNYMKALGGNLNNLAYQQVVRAQNQAREESEKILAGGEDVPVYRWHNHPVHRLTHEDDANDARHREAQQENLVRMQQHLEMHDQFMPMTQEAQIQQLQGAVGELQQQLAVQQEKGERDQIEADMREQHAEEAGRVAAQAEVAAMGPTEVLGGRP